MSPPFRGPSRVSTPATDELTTDGRERLFADFFETTYDDVRRFVRRRAEDDAVDDAVSETFLVAWRRLSAVPEDHEARLAWLYATARRLLANQRRSRRRRDALTLRLQEHPTHPDEDPAAVIHRVDLARAFARLGPRDQEVLALIAWDGLTQAGAAEVLAISNSALEARLRRARRRLRAHLNVLPQGEPS